VSDPGSDPAEKEGALAISVETESGYERIGPPTEAERAVADLLPIDAGSQRAKATVDSVPLWFHTFSLDGHGIYTPGIARDHRYRVPVLPGFSGRRVLDVGTFDGFYAFLAEARGAERVIAIDNEQYVDWVRSRFGIELEGGAGFQAIAELLDSTVVYMRLDGYDLDALREQFDLILCCGILHRVRDPLGLLAVLRRRLGPGGEVLLETHGVNDQQLEEGAGIHVCEPGELYRGDDFVYWGFSGASIDRLAGLAGFPETEIHDALIVDGRQRIICTLRT
jgi:tRNA (mo5U34)-methyltransferase